MADSPGILTWLQQLVLAVNNIGNQFKAAVTGPGASVSGDIASFSGTTGTVLADSGILVSGGTIKSSVISGTTAADNSPPGNLGEYLSASSPQITMTSGTNANLTSISLTAGDWDVWGNIITTPAGTTTTSLIQAGVSTVSLTFPNINTGALVIAQASFPAGATNAYSTGTARLSLAAATTVYLVGEVSFAVSTLQAIGSIFARRVR